MPAPRPALRRLSLRAPLALAGLLALAACGGDTPPAPLPEPGAGAVRLRLSANVALGADERDVRIIVRYRRVDGDDLPLPSEPATVRVVAGETKEQPVVVNLAPCLQDPRRLGGGTAGSQCVLRVEMQLLSVQGELIATDLKEAGPVTAGASVAPIAFTLGAPVITFSSDAVSFTGTTDFPPPAEQLVRVTSAKADGTSGGAPLGTLSAAAAYGGSAAQWLTVAVDQAGSLSLRPSSTALPPDSYRATVTVAGAALGIQPKSLVVTYLVRASRALTVAGAGPGTGRVSAAGGIDCFVNAGAISGTCVRPYEPDADVTLTATPAAGHTFDGWSGACTGTGACTLRLSEARSVTARLTPFPQTFGVGIGGTGSGSVSGGAVGIDCRRVAGIVSGACAGSAPYGTVVALTATPAADSRFVGWGGDCSGTGGCTVTLDRARSVSATFATIEHSVSVSVGGAGAGTVTGPSGVNCARAANGTVTGTCSASVAQGTTVSLSAAPGPNSIFAGWAGACSGTGACTIIVTGPSAVAATFSLATRSLSVGVSGTGTGSVGADAVVIDCQLTAGVVSGTCSAAVPFGTVVTLTATADPATSRFVGWVGACAGASITCTVRLDQARSASAIFELVARQLTVRGAGTGAGTVSSTPAGINGCATTDGSTCTGTFPHGTRVTLAATASTGSLFTGWSGACVGTGACTVTMDAARSATATFTAFHALAVSTIGAGTGTVQASPAPNAGVPCTTTPCPANYTHGTVVTLTAAPGLNSRFDGWTGDCAGTALTCTVTLDRARAVSATFALIEHTVSVAVGGNGAGTVTSPSGINCVRAASGTVTGTCAAAVVQGTTVTLSASPAANSRFVSWGGDCSGTGGCTVTLDRARSVSATFELIQHTVSVSVSGSGAGTVTGTNGINCTRAADGTVTGTCSASVAQGSTVTLNAAAGPNSTFGGWAGGGCTGVGACTFTVTASASVSATFAVILHTVSVSIGGTGAGTVTGPNGINCARAIDGTVTGTCSASVAQGTLVTLNAAPRPNSTFGGWAGACSGTGACTFTVTASASVSATFPEGTRTIRFSNIVLDACNALEAAYTVDNVRTVIASKPSTCPPVPPVRQNFPDVTVQVRASAPVVVTLRDLSCAITYDHTNTPPRHALVTSVNGGFDIRINDAGGNCGNRNVDNVPAPNGGNLIVFVEGLAPATISLVRPQVDRRP